MNADNALGAAPSRTLAWLTAAMVAILIVSEIDTMTAALALSVASAMELPTWSLWGLGAMLLALSAWLGRLIFLVALRSERNLGNDVEEDA